MIFTQVLPQLRRYYSTATSASIKGCLSGLTVIDLSRILAGPFCTMLLSDLGAEVIKIEKPGLGDLTRTWGPPFVNGQSAYFLTINRNKKVIILFKIF